MAFSPDGNTLALSSALGTISTWATESGQHRRSFAGHTNEVWALAFSPDGRMLLSGGLDGTARLWDAEAHSRFGMR